MGGQTPKETVSRPVQRKDRFEVSRVGTGYARTSLRQGRLPPVTLYGNRGHVRRDPRAQQGLRGVPTGYPGREEGVDEVPRGSKNY